MQSTRKAPWAVILSGTIMLIIGFLASLALGSTDVAPAEFYRAFSAFDGSKEQIIIRTVRLPRAMIAAIVGAGLAVSGVIMQALTRNPLASPGILGVNAGAALFLVGAIFLMGAASPSALVWFAFLGGCLAGLLVYLLGSAGRGGLNSLKLTVAGAAVTTFLLSLNQGILLLNERTLDEVRFWMAGSVSGREVSLFLQVLPYLVFGLLGAVVFSRQLTTFSLGEETAKGLGQKTGWVKVFGLALVVMLAGSSVAIAGPIGFVGLVVPHLARAMVGSDYRYIIPAAAVFGAILLLAADIVSRFLIQPQEAPVGVVTALIGAPFLIHLARREAKQV